MPTIVQSGSETLICSASADGYHCDVVSRKTTKTEAPKTDKPAEEKKSTAADTQKLAEVTKPVEFQLIPGFYAGPKY